MPQPPQPSSGGVHDQVIRSPSTAPVGASGAAGGPYGVPETDWELGSQNRRFGVLAGTAQATTVKSYCWPFVRFVGVDQPLVISSGEPRSRPAIAGLTSVR